MSVHVEPELIEALHELAGVFGDQMTAMHVGGKFTCSEAETIANVLAFSGHWDAHLVWLHGHAEGDSPGDAHAVCKHCDAVVYVSGDEDEIVTDTNDSAWCSDDHATEHEPRWSAEEE